MRCSGERFPSNHFLKVLRSLLRQTSRINSTVNGEYVCRGPARGYQKSWPFDEVDIEKWLKKGRNVIAVRAYNPGRSNFQYIHQGYAGFHCGG